MSDTNQHQETLAAESSTPLLDYTCTPWRLSSQRVADLYHAGAKLWSKADLEDIEKQLEQAFYLDRITLRDLEGKQVQVKNPLYGVQRPIWRPYVKYRDYWSLVLDPPEGPAELYRCSYIVDWKNVVDQDFRGNIEDWQDLFEARRQLWNSSITCKLFKAQLRKLLFEAQHLHHHKLTKIICLGLGDFALTVFMVEQPPGKGLSPDFESSSPMMQHAMALTIAEEARRYNPNIRLVAQDPQYIGCTTNFLRNKGFEVKGQFGAGVFSEVDDESLVISAYPSAPIRQIIADIAKPAMFITNFRDHRVITSQRGKPFLDTESPRTMQMWRSYESHKFTVSPVEFELMEGVRNFSLFARKDAVATLPAGLIGSVRSEETSLGKRTATETT